MYALAWVDGDGRAFGDPDGGGHLLFLASRPAGVAMTGAVAQARKFSTAGDAEAFREAIAREEGITERPIPLAVVGIVEARGATQYEREGGDACRSEDDPTRRRDGHGPESRPSESPCPPTSWSSN